jgi:hypothetical protein
MQSVFSIRFHFRPIARAGASGIVRQERPRMLMVNQILNINAGGCARGTLHLGDLRRSDGLKGSTSVKKTNFDGGFAAHSVPVSKLCMIG